MADAQGIVNDPPFGYVTPPWPSLYFPWLRPKELYEPEDIWRFTLYWTLTLHGAIFGLSAVYAAVIFGREGAKRVPFAVGIPLIIVALQGMVALIVATILGFALSAIYAAAYLRMSTWVPFLWVVAQTLVVVASSYTTVDVLL